MVNAWQAPYWDACHYCYDAPVVMRPAHIIGSHWAMCWAIVPLCDVHDGEIPG